MNKIHQEPRIICDAKKNQNYLFDGCMEYLMECIGESKNFDYCFFSGITGDSFTQIYCNNIRDMISCYSDGFLSKIIKNIFDICGYNFEYFNNLSGKDHKTYDNIIKAYIKKDVPVIAKTINKENNWTSYCCIYGYDDDKFYATNGQSTENIIYSDQYLELICIKETKSKTYLADVYRDTVMNIPSMINLPETKEYAFGKRALLSWAASFQNITFDDVSTEENDIWYTHPDKNISCWNMHGNYLCMLASNEYSIPFLEKTLQLNPDMGFINDLIPLFYKITHEGFNKLIGMSGGYQIQPKDIKNKLLMKPISDAIVNLANLHNDIIRVFDTVSNASYA